MPVEPLRLPVQGNRTVVFTAGGKLFPDKVELDFEGPVDGNPRGTLMHIAAFNMSSSKIAVDLADKLLLDPTDVQGVIAKYWPWARTAVKVLKDDAEQTFVAEVLPYNLRQRTMEMTKEQALSYSTANSIDDFLAVLKRTSLPANTLLEWNKTALKHLACVDLDFHAVEFDQRPTEDELDRLGRGLQPAPSAWWRTQGRGLHAIYHSAPGYLYDANELAAACAAELIATPLISLRKGTVELKASTRHPGAEHNGRACGPVHLTNQNDKLVFLTRFGKSEATVEEIAEVQTEYGLTVGQRLNHSHCLLDPGHESQSKPIEIIEDGLLCYSCLSRFGRGFQSWGFIRKKMGMPGGTGRAITPLSEAFTKFAHSDHVDYLFERLMPEIPVEFRRLLHKARLKQEHADKNGKVDPRVAMVFHSFGFVRGLDAWLHADTLLTAGRPLNMRDVSVLPSCMTADLDGAGTDKEVSQSQSAVSVHTNNGRIDGWMPLLPYLFEPIYFVNNEAKENLSYVRCYPKRKTTKERVAYLAPTERVSLADAEKTIEEYFPGVSINYVKALIIAMGCAESGQGDIPILWATGPTEAAKTTTARIVMEMYGEGFHSMSEVPEDRLDQIFGETLEKTRLIMFDDFAKESENYKRFHTFMIRMNRSGHTYHKLHYGERTTAINNAVILTDWRIPAFFSHDPQFGRRVHLIRLTNRLQKSWSALGHFVEGWWQTNAVLAKAANSLHSWMIDEFFPEGDRDSFATKMERLGIHKLKDEVGQDEGKEAMADIVRSLVLALGESPAAPVDIQKRLGSGMQLVSWNEGSPVGGPCVLLCDSLGSDKRSQDELRHVLDPFQLELPKMFVLAEGVVSVEFDLKAWGKNLYIRLVEAGRSIRSKSRRVNREVFSTWPPTPIHPDGGPESAESEDDMPIVILDEPQAPTGPFTVYLDFETQSECDLKAHGSYVYAEHPSTKVVCAALEFGQRRIFWTENHHNLTLPAGVEYEWGIDFLRDMVTDPHGCTIVAHNMEFERALWTRTLKLPEPVQWYDTMDLTLARGLPGGADKAGEYLLGLRKDPEGYSHMMKTCKPQKGRGRGAGYFMPPIDDLCVQKMLDYNFRDVDISHGIANRFGLRMQPEWEQAVCDLHHDITFWGIRIDKEFCETLKTFDDEFKVLAGELVERVTNGEVKRTDLTRTEFLQQVINEQLPMHLHLKTMQMAGLEKLIEAAQDSENPNRDLISPEVVEVMKARLLVSRAALAKVDKALDCISADGRAKAQLKYWAAHTGRFGGTHIQPQNMKRPDEDFDIPAAITAVENKDREKFRELCIGKPPYELLSSLVRGMFIPEEGNVFVSADFSSIEARVLMWLADDEEGMEEHRAADRGEPDVYCKLATTLYGRVITKKDKTERQAGKIGQLACGYQGSVGAVDRFATTYGLDFAAAGITPIQVVNAFRSRYPRVKALWYACEEAFRQALLNKNSRRPGRDKTVRAAKCVFEALNDRVEITLPSGRKLTYMNARLERDENSFHSSKTTIYYDTAVKGQVVSHSIYGGLICENIDQAIARDLLVLAMLKVADAGYGIAMHVHDEILAEVAEALGAECAAFVKQAMESVPEWGIGIPLHAEPSVIYRYGK